MATDINKRTMNEKGTSKPFDIKRIRLSRNNNNKMDIKDEDDDFNPK